MNIYKHIPQLSQLYSEPHRHYHSLKHIHRLVALINSQTTKFFIKPQYHDIFDDYRMNAILNAVAWFHDCYYDPYARKGMNEELSNEIFIALTNDEPYLNHAKCNTISSIILATAKHTENIDFSSICDRNSDIELMKIFLDLDMFGFYDRKEFTTNSELIRKEYYNTSDSDYLIGRTAFLTSLLNKDRIYYSMEDFVEEGARLNISRELESLSINKN